MITIKRIDRNDEMYAAFAKAHGSVFNQPQWLNIYGEGLLLHGIFNDNNELIGAFNLFAAKKIGLSYYLVPPYSPSNAFVLNNPAQNLANRITFEKAVHQALSDYFAGLGGFLFLTAFPVGTIDTQVYFWSKYKVVPNYTYHLGLDQSKEILFSGLTSEKRKSLRKAEKDGIEVRPCNDNQLVLGLVLKTFARKQKELNSGLLHNILFTYANPHNSFAYVAYMHNKPIACCFCVHDGQTAYYLFGGYDETAKHHGAGPSCMWQAILHAQRLGLKTFDFEGSMLPEVERYFREFGGALVPYYTIQKAWLPLEMVLKLKMRNRF